MLADVSVGQDESQDSELRWTGKVGSEGRLLTVFKDDELFIFVSDTRDSIAFDGWHVRSLTGFGFDSVLRFVASDGSLMLADGKGQLVLVCRPWTSEVSVNGITTFSQYCNEVSRSNSITVSPEGEILEIDQVITPDGKRVTLRALKGRG